MVLGWGLVVSSVGVGLSVKVRGPLVTPTQKVLKFCTKEAL